jgi:hypothetical protein
MLGTGACAGSCHALTVTEEQIAIRERGRDPREMLGEAERQLSCKSSESAQISWMDHQK